MEGPDFDSVLNVFSPDGKLLQLEHAQKASDQGTLVTFAISDDTLAIFCELKNKEKNKIMEMCIYEVNRLDSPNIKTISFSGNKSSSRFGNIMKGIKEESGATEDINGSCGPIYMCFSGLRPDNMRILWEARWMCRNWAYVNLKEINVSTLAKLLANYLHDYTISDSYRPFGTKIALFGQEKIDNKMKMRLFILTCDGNSVEMHAGAIGNKEDQAISFLESKYSKSLGKEEVVTLCFETVKNTAQNDPDRIKGYLVDKIIHEITE